ncbi:MAG: DNA polymerase III subunit chi [Pseudomonadota bacterium]
MAKVDFYLLESGGLPARNTFACRLVGKAHKLDHVVHVMVDNEQQLDATDKLLWTFSDDSFLAHDRWPGEHIVASVTLGLADDGIPDAANVCINLGDTAVATDCARVAEVVASEATAKAAGRQHYATYRDRGWDLDTHQIAIR